MATVDLSRSSTDFRKHFTSVRAQMGRVLTEDDHNENERLHGEDMRASRLDIIGPAGSPDDGFAIQNPVITNGNIDFQILPGTFYLGGNRLTLDAMETFQVQLDWLNMAPSDMPPAPAAARFDLVLLECWQQPVSAVEDSELFEVALGGPDTSQRMRLMRRVRAFANLASADCAQDFGTLAAGWTAAGLGTMNNKAELVVDTKLKVGFVPGPTGDLCTPAIAGGYLGADNQAIRVQLVDSSSFTWGFDNAAPLYRVQVGNNSVGQKRKITMETLPKDQAHWPTAGQVVEVLPWSAVLPNEEKTAEMHGFLARVDTSYDPDTNEFFLTADVPAGFGEQWLTRPDAAALQPEFFYMRVWNRGTDVTSPLAIPFVNLTPATLGNTGLSVTFSGNDHHPDDYWIIAARPESPNLVVPWLLESGRGPNGVRRWYTTLAVIQWTPGGGGHVVHDCREKFPPLTKLKGCCTCSVGDGVHSFGDFDTIQKGVDSLPDGGEICVRPGVYSGNVVISNHHDLHIHGCGWQTLLQDAGKAAGPVVTIQDSWNIEISNLVIEAEAVIGIQLLSTSPPQKHSDLNHISLHDLHIIARDISAIDCRGAEWISIERNHIEAVELTAPLGNTTTVGLAPLVFVIAEHALIERNMLLASGIRRIVTASGGLQIGGASEHVAIRRNLIQGGNGNGITLGSITFVAPPVIFVGKAPANRFFYFGFTIDPNGCLTPDPNPGTPTGPNGNPTPQSDGDLFDIRIIDNEIRDMGQSGISTVRFFAAGIITVRWLQVELNRILNCVRLELGDNPFNPALPLGFGGIALIAVERFTLRDNFIEGNGISSIDPICGVYLLLARGFIAENNQILDNGRTLETQKSPTAGPRGGIYIGMAATSLAILAGAAIRAGAALNSAAVQPSELTGFPAIKITGNTVVSPLGRAIRAVARGLVSITNNELTSRGVESGDGMNGAAVLILDLGFTYEIAEFSNFSTMGINQPSTTVVASRLAPGGEILFTDNQVLLAPPVQRGQFVFSSVELLSLDDVAFEDNQCEARMGAVFFLVHGLVLAWSTRMNGNRFEEAITPGLSGLTIAVLNCTSMNQGTRCFAVIGQPVVTVNTGNASFASYLALVAKQADPCTVFQKRFATNMVKYGFSA
jgi:hypothetical protein